MFYRRRKAAVGIDGLMALCEALLSNRGEVSGARLAREVIATYRALPDAGVDAFFERLVSGFSPDATAVQQAAADYERQRTPEHLLALQRAVESRRQELFRRWNMAPGGISALIDLRRRLLPTLAAHPDRVIIDADLMHLFRSWFNRGFLVLQRIDWKTPAVILERLIAYEAVHQIQGWDDLRRRLDADRRCYAFFHPVMPEDPLIFIEVALTRGMAADVQPLINPKAPVIDPTAADTAIFYSITNTQEGLRGVSFGNVLIKQVVEDLEREFPRIRTFATLSPIPGFRAWAATADPRWEAADLTTLAEPQKREVMSLCARYLLHARRGREPLDPVERFHLANGAALERINWMGDPSSAGMRRSFGLMANYVYKPDEVERNHEAYAGEYKVVASRAIEQLARRT